MRFLLKTIQVILIAYKSKVLPECENEILYILDDRIFYDFFVNIRRISDTYHYQAAAQ